MLWNVLRIFLRRLGAFNNLPTTSSIPIYFQWIHLLYHLFDQRNAQKKCTKKSNCLNTLLARFFIYKGEWTTILPILSRKNKQRTKQEYCHSKVSTIHAIKKIKEVNKCLQEQIFSVVFKNNNNNTFIDIPIEWCAKNESKNAKTQ